MSKRCHHESSTGMWLISTDKAQALLAKGSVLKASTRKAAPAVASWFRGFLLFSVFLFVGALGHAQPYQIIKSLGTNGQSLSGLVQDSNGWLYGSVYPDSGPGSVFKVRPDGSSYTTLHEFTPATKDGSQSASRLLLLGNTLFGTTKSGGSNNFGTVFRLNTDGSGYQVLYHFGTNDAQFPYAGLVQGQGGSLYGTTIGGGNGNRGTVYKIQPNGAGYQVIRHFGPGFGTNGAYLYGGVVVGSNGVLFGTTFAGGTNGFGNIFRVNPDGSDYQIIHQFAAGDANNPYSMLTRGNDGFLYGSASMGGSNNYGAVFKLREDGSGYMLLASVGSGNDGRLIYQALTLGKDNALYGVTATGGTNNSGTLFRVQKDGTGYHTLLHFRTNEFASADLFVNEAGEFFGALQRTAGSETGSLFRFVQPSLRAIGTDGTGFHIQLSGLAGPNYTVESTTNFIHWTPWVTTNLTGSSLDLWDSRPPGSHRFYRIR